MEMDFYDPVRGQRWFYQQPESTLDGSWYSGVPIWALAERSGIRSATFFWPGADAEIGGTRPSFYRSYDARVTHDQKLNTLGEWVGSANGTRPRLMMMYFSDIDSAGHRFGPDSQELRDAVAKMDLTLGRIFEITSKSPFPMDVLIVSDHGMSKIERRIDLSDQYDFRPFRVINNQFMVQLYSDDTTVVERAWEALEKRSPLWTAYKRNQLAGLHYSKNRRVGDLVIIPNGPYMLGINQQFPDIQGMHGYDPSRWPEMLGILYGRGPSFQPAARIAAVSNTNIHGLVAGMLGLKPAVPLNDPSILGLLTAPARKRFQ